MGIRIERTSDESLCAALARFNRLSRQQHRRSWAKARRGYYEKPSVVRRRQAAIGLISSRRSTVGMAPFKRYANLGSLLRR
ncbi:hypothetical protein PLANPX_0457 [Lacipirellula parvula]|uniref:30S ribosomal protein S21 n=1 Tax=Lacipirellula parvula TaxID=2650471 RepID=A0A5K7X3A9_9BACT|nr:hypothetical protein PLANPX_0457 [Lacipirellula parvula]